LERVAKRKFSNPQVSRTAGKRKAPMMPEVPDVLLPRLDLGLTVILKNRRRMIDKEQLALP
jgi:hypothetical protein